jgi:transposase
MRFTLNSLSGLVPDWLASHFQPEWANRYGPRADNFRLPDTKAKRLAYAQQIGQDGFWLMDQIDMDKQAAYFWQLPAVDILRLVWI